MPRLACQTSDLAVPRPLSGLVSPHRGRGTAKSEVWQTGSPDMNVIEYCLSNIESRLAMGWVDGKHGNREAWVEGFAKTFQDPGGEGILSSCIRSMPQRLKGVVEACGGPTKW